MSTLHIYLDESGNFKFSPKGSKYFVFAAVWTYSPLPLAQDLNELRFGLIKQGHDVPEFHAKNDRPHNRERVFDLLAGHLSWQFTSIVIEKSKVWPFYHEPWRFYPRFMRMLVRFIIPYRLEPETDTVLVFTDALSVGRYKEKAKEAFKSESRTRLPNHIDLHCFHHNSCSNYWLQVADYCAWSVGRKWEQSKPDAYQKIRSRLAAYELDVLQRVHRHFY